MNPSRPGAGATDVGTARGSEGRSEPGRSEPGRGRAPRSARGWLLACAALAALDFALVWRVRELNRRVAGLTRLVEAHERPLLLEGEAFPALTLIDADSRPVPLLDGAGSSGTLLLVSSETCEVCADVRPVWAVAAERCADSPLRVLELVLDAKPASLPAREQGYPLVASGGDAWSLVGRIPGIPAALLIDANGIVRRSFFGAEHQGLPQAVEEYLLRQGGDLAR